MCYMLPVTHASLSLSMGKYNCIYLFIMYLCGQQLSLKCNNFMNYALLQN